MKNEILKPEQLIKRLYNYCKKNNYHCDHHDYIQLFKDNETYTVKSYNKYVKENYPI